VSDSTSIRVTERTSLNVYKADIFNCSRHPAKTDGRETENAKQQSFHSAQL